MVSSKNTFFFGGGANLFRFCAGALYTYGSDPYTNMCLIYLSIVKNQMGNMGSCLGRLRQASCVEPGEDRVDICRS